MRIEGASSFAAIIMVATALPASAQEYAQMREVQGVSDVGNDVVKQELTNARQAVMDAQSVAEKIIADAQMQANLIRQNAVVNDAPTDLTPIEIQSARVAVEISAGTIEEIANAIMPLGWRVLVDIKDASVLQKRFQYVSTKSRDQALRDLLLPAGLQHQYFFDLTDNSGAKSPLLVISSR